MVIFRVERYLNFLFVRMASGDLKAKAGFGMPVILRLQEILFSLTGETMERLIMLELWKVLVVEL